LAQSPCLQGAAAGRVVPQRRAAGRVRRPRRRGPEGRPMTAGAQDLRTRVPVLGAAEAIVVASELAEDFAASARRRDAERIIPVVELDRLSASGLLAITVPASFGGAGLPASAVVEVIRVLSTGDPNIGQIP